MMAASVTAAQNRTDSPLLRRRLLDLDPDLGQGLDPDRFGVAHHRLAVRVLRYSTGAWSVPPESPCSGGLGLLVVEGFVLRRVALPHRAGAELLGAGDVLRPWQPCDEHEAYPFETSFEFLGPVAVAVLDRAVTAEIGRFPEITAALIGRVDARTQRTAGQVVLAQLASVAHRLLLYLWRLAELWGRVRVDGIVLPVPLTHEVLGLLVGARRPSVSAALRVLRDQGLVVPVAGHGFRLLGEPPHDLQLVRGSARRTPLAA